MSIRTLLAAVVAVAVLLAVLLALQAYQQTAVKRLVIAEPRG
jgi:hypothetical protein